MRYMMIQFEGEEILSEVEIEAGDTIAATWLDSKFDDDENFEEMDEPFRILEPMMDGDLEKTINAVQDSPYCFEYVTVGKNSIITRHDETFWDLLVWYGEKNTG